MLENFIGKINLKKLIGILLVCSIFILAVSILTEDNDRRKQIIDENGSQEERLCSILSMIEGVGDVEVMLRYDEKDLVCGVIVIAEGGSSPVVENKLTQGVSSLYDIPVSSVCIFEKEQEE